MRFNLPRKAEETAKRARNSGALSHAGLLFYRYLDGSDSKGRYRQLSELINIARFPTLELRYLRLKALLRDWDQRGLAWTCFEGELAGRMAPGLGIATAFENGISLDHIHGFPYIPGSSLKGIARDYAAEVEGVEPESKQFIAVFGGRWRRGPNEVEERMGNAVFLDALPICSTYKGTELLTVDVITPHFSDYYGSDGRCPPVDYLNPNPIYFLAVKEGARFIFALIARPMRDRNGDIVMKACEILSHAERWLKGALSHLGVGGKTSLGYGRFHNFQRHVF